MKNLVKAIRTAAIIIAVLTASFAQATATSSCSATHHHSYHYRQDCGYELW